MDQQIVFDVCTWHRYPPCPPTWFAVMANGVDRKPPPSLPPHRPSRAVACLPACLPGRLPDCLVATHNPTPSLASCDANKFEEEQQLLGLPVSGHPPSPAPAPPARVAPPVCISICICVCRLHPQRWGKRLKLWEQHDQQQGHFPVGGQPARRPGFQFGSEAPPQQSSPSSAPPSCLSRSSHPSLNPHPKLVYRRLSGLSSVGLRVWAVLRNSYSSPQGGCGLLVLLIKAAIRSPVWPYLIFPDSKMKCAIFCQ